MTAGKKEKHNKEIETSPEEKQAVSSGLCGCLVIDPCGAHVEPCSCFVDDEAGCYETSCGCINFR